MQREGLTGTMTRQKEAMRYKCLVDGAPGQNHHGLVGDAGKEKEYSTFDRSAQIASDDCAGSTFSQRKATVVGCPWSENELLSRLQQPVVLAQYLLQLGVRYGVDFEVVDAFHGLRGDEGVDDGFFD